MSYFDLAHKPFPILQAIRIPDAKAAVDKEWEKLERLPAWQVTKVKSKKEVIEKAHKEGRTIEKAQKEGRTVHFAALMDSCHLKKTRSLEQKF